MLPLLDAMVPDARADDNTLRPWKKSVAAHPRLICCYVPNGVNIAEWVPKDSGTSYTLSPPFRH
jgi:hypothetical protein